MKGYPSDARRGKEALKPQSFFKNRNKGRPDLANEEQERASELIRDDCLPTYLTHIRRVLFAFRVCR